MANTGVTFNGKTYTIPGLYSMFDSAMTYSKANASAKIIALVGESDGGEPNTVMFFNEPSAAKKVLKSGELLKAANKAWNPVSQTKEGLDLGGADIIACVRVNQATQARKVLSFPEEIAAVIGDIVPTISETTTGTLTVEGSFTGTENVTYKVEIVSITDTDVYFNYSIASEDKEQHYLSEEDIKISESGYVIPDTGLTIKFTEGVFNVGDSFLIPAYCSITALSPKWEVVSKDWGRETNKIQIKIEDGSTVGTKKFSIYDVTAESYEIYDNLGTAFSIKYTGDQTYASISIITDGAGNAIKLQTYIGASAEAAIVDLDIDLSVRTFKSIRALVKHLQGFENYQVTYSALCNQSCNVSDLDYIKKQSIKDEFKVTDLLSDLSIQLANNSNLVQIGEIYNKESGIVENIPYTNLSGGTAGKIPASWVKFFDLLAKYPISYVVPLTSDEYIITECLEHVTSMSSTTLGKERRMMCGTGVNTSVEDAAKKARELASDRCQLISQGFYDLNESNQLELYPPYILAAQFAGRCAFLPDGEAATQDVFRMSKIEKELDPQSDIPNLLAAGVVPFEFVIATDAFASSCVRCVEDITTSQENDVLRTERSVGVIADSTNKAIKTAIDGLSIGRKTTIGILQTIKNAVITVLENRQHKEEVIVAYKDVNVYKESQTIYVEYSAAPTEPNNFVFISGHYYSKDLMLADTETVSGGVSTESTL